MRKTSIDFITSARVEQVKGHRTECREDLYWWLLLKFNEKIQLCALYDDINVLIKSVAEFFLHWGKF